MPPQNKSGLLSRAFSIFAKDVRLELRSRSALSTILMFGVTTLVVVSFSVGQAELPPKLLAALYWIILFFSCIAGMSQSFVREEEAGTALGLRLVADPLAVYLGKLSFNLLLMTTIGFVVTPLFFIFTDASTGNPGLLVLILLAGILALCAATTLVAAIIARAATRGALFAVIAFPLLIVPLWALVASTGKILDNQGFAFVAGELQVLFSFIVVMVTSSIMLFRFVWQE
ncbi:MAG: heme exporter protein CcmB [candidate division Zixibacteria bacterium]|nr:heme exporter protein CcmB [candidate division Zixibacteria bacterium]